MDSLETLGILFNFSDWEPPRPLGLVGNRYQCIPVLAALAFINTSALDAVAVLVFPSAEHVVAFLASTRADD